MTQKIALLGYGSIGKRYNQILKEIDSSFEIDIVDIFPNFKKIEDIENQRYDLCIICTPPTSHIDLAKKITADAFFFEKPLDTSFAKINQNLEFFKQKKTMVCSNLLFSKHLEKVKEFIFNASVVNVKYGSYLPFWRENHKNLYSSRSDQGGGVFWDVVPHECFLVYHFLGKPLNVHVFKKRILDLTVDTDDFANIIFEYPETVVNFQFSYLTKMKHRFFEFVLKTGETKMIDFSEGQSLPNQHTVSDIDETYVKMWKHFFTFEKPLNSYEDAFNFMKIFKEIK